VALEGTFKDFGLADIFQLVALQKKTGVLTVRGEGNRLVTVSFEKGTVVFADEFQRTDAERLGSVLLRTRRVTPEQLSRAVEIQQQTSQRLGYVLMDQRIVSGEDLRQALQLQVKETVYRLFRWQEGGYHFSPEPVSYDREIYVPLSAELLLMEGVRMIDEWPILERRIPSFELVLERVPGAVPPRAKAAPATGRSAIDELMGIVEDGLGAPAGAAKEEGPLGAREAALLELVDGRRTVQELIDLGQMGEFDTCKALYGFLSLGLVRARDAGAAAAAQGGGAARAAAAPVGLRSRFAPREIAVVAVAALLFATAFLFNPWGLVAQRFRGAEAREAAVELRDEVRLRRIRVALDVWYLEKQSYPAGLDELAESGILARRELRSAAGRPFAYQGGERDYRLARE